MDSGKEHNFLSYRKVTDIASMRADVFVPQRMHSFPPATSTRRWDGGPISEIKKPGVVHPDAGITRKGTTITERACSSLSQKLAFIISKGSAQMDIADKVYNLAGTREKGASGFFFFNQTLLKSRVMIWYAGSRLDDAIRKYPVFIWYDDQTAGSFKGLFNRRDLEGFEFTAPRVIVQSAVNFLEGYTSERDICSQISSWLSTCSPAGYLKGLEERRQLREGIAPVVREAELIFSQYINV
ncbi:hypothetical protein MKQ70_32665 [Chitinophaga sedimenti]|uniref:hypothetical protein n=1 Tax=Chitinophaga sedimenti TaxID=2033606 RepID=UPI0020062554|nr:hypothetical protein [Chitinophaga sedimenti]MCK7559469.1 hypothetical protein [Chitinophaga sedimenti]